MPRAPRFFIEPDQIQGREIKITGSDVHHIRTVLRKGPGDVITVLDGTGAEYAARIIGLDRSRVIAEITGETRRARTGPAVILVQGLAKSDKMDWVVQKATELGVSAIVPLVTERTVVKVRDEGSRRARWQKIAREAAMQSSRTDIPAIEGITPFGSFVAAQDPRPGTLLLLPWEEAAVPINAVLGAANRKIERIIVLIGPEGGFSPKEAQAAKERGFHAVSLGPHILRTETAALSVLSMILYETGIPPSSPELR